MARPYVLLSAAISIDGYLDDSSDARLMLSNEADLDRVDDARASVDAILVGANTIRRKYSARGLTWADALLVAC